MVCEEFQLGGVAGPGMPAKVPSGNLQLVAVVAVWGIREIGLADARCSERSAPSVERRDTGDPVSSPEGAPRHIVEKVTTHRALPGEDRGDSGGIIRDQHVLVQQVAVDQVSSLGARRQERVNPLLARAKEAIRAWVGR